MICLKISTFVVSTTTFKFSRTHVLCCDLLKNIYLCGINNNGRKRLVHVQWVVICLKISTFVVSTTTGKHSHSLCVSCDLLKNIYLCGINNNSKLAGAIKKLVVICLKISTFVVSTTTSPSRGVPRLSCDLLKNIYLCGINNNQASLMYIPAKL